MTKKMLIDASHPEETRVVVVDHARVEELDFESQAKRQLRGNVYLARVTRVEPSLQAAFVEFGGNRHGFLAFSEIHSDYYQIPFEDRQALLEAEEAENREAEAAEEAKAERDSQSAPDDDEDEGEDPLKPAANTFLMANRRKEIDYDDPFAPAAKTFLAASRRKEPVLKVKLPIPVDDEDLEDSELDEDVADEDDKEVADEQKKMDHQRRKRMSRRRYKIQEVIKRGQILLVQAVKEERGNKGAALTTYLSLAGRYCVLMPNTPRGGGISRKIAHSGDRKRLKAIMSELEVPVGMGVIVRTAGAKRTKVEIGRDYDYLARLWDTIRETTMESVAPALIHQEGDLVKRSLRDLYNRDIEEVLVQGEDAYKDAKSFIEMLMPSHAKNIKHYEDDVPLFLRYQVESQLEASLDPIAQLPSGGYLVIHPTEALVSVDVNSGRSTKERNVERTALKTNLEAADEVARQMRLRDLAGLVVIDFIDMDENRNNRAVEKRMKEALSYDRARVQMGRISQFGLMEISRQRRRRSLLEASTASCENCGGVGRKRSVESSALKAIRAVEEEGVRGKAKRIRLRVSPNVALYLFNEKRDLLQHVDAQFDVFTELVSDDTLHRPEFEIERVEMFENSGTDPLIALERDAKQAMKNRPKRKKSRSRSQDNNEDDESGNSRNEGRSKNNRRRKGKRKTGNEDIEESKSDTNDNDNQTESKNGETPSTDGEPRKRRRRRGRRGGRKRSGEENASENASENAEATSHDEAPENTVESSDESGEASRESKPRNRGRGSRKRKPRDESGEDQSEAARAGEDKSAEAETPSEAQSPAKTSRKRTRKAAPSKSEAMPSVEEAASESKVESSKPRRRTRKKAPTKPTSSSDDAKTESTKPEEKPQSPTKAKKRVRKAAPKKSVSEETEAKPKKESKPKDEEKPKKERSKPKTQKTSNEKPADKAKKGWWSKANPFT